MKSLLQSINNIIEPLRGIADKIGAPLFDLAIRLYMANIFFASGWSKVEYFLNDDWGSAIYLYQDIHPVPGIPAELAAAAGTIGEVVLSVLLAFGLFARFGAAGLLVVAFTIQFLVPADYGIQNIQHYFWMFLLGSVLIKGPGVISLDWLLLKWLRK